MSWDDALFQRHLTTRRFGRQVRCFTEIDSTNRWLCENWNEFTLNGAIAITEHQTGGRGRFSRKWEDVPGKSLLFSLLISSSDEASRAGFHQMLPAIALAKTLKEQLGDNHEVCLKWPNDVLLNNRKLAGILAERFKANDKTFTIVGVGINVNSSLQEMPEPTREMGASVFSETGESPQREPLLANIINEWEPLYDALRGGNTEAIRDSWRKYGPQIDTPIVRKERGKEISGSFAGIGAEGQLLLRDNQGILHEFFTGDILH